MAILAGLCVTAFVLVSNHQRQQAYEAYDREDYARAAAIFDAWPWVRDRQEPKYEYSLARVREAQPGANAAETAALFEELGEYADSPRRAAALRYAEGRRLMEQGEPEQALGVFNALPAPGYEDSAELARQLAGYLEADKLEGALERYQAFGALAEEGFLDSAAKAKQAAAEVYALGWDAYAAGDFEQAGEQFAAINGYADAGSYARLTRLWRQAQAARQENAAEGYATARRMLPTARRLAQVVDAGPVLMSESFLHVFLEGRWETEAEGETGPEAGAKTFYMDIGRSEFEFDDSLGITGQYDFYGTQMVSAEGGPTVTFGYLGYDRIQIAVEGAGVEEYVRVA